MNFLLYTIPSLTTKTTDMKVNELRIGNWVDRDGKYIQIRTIDGYLNEVSEGSMLTQHSIDRISPIPLTPEILEKAGFEIDEDKGFVREDDLKYPVHSSQLDIIHIRGQFFLWVEIDEDAFYNFRMREITHLHQLQNLYFSLVGEELPITL